MKSLRNIWVAHHMLLQPLQETVGFINIKLHPDIAALIMISSLIF